MERTHRQDRYQYSFCGIIRRFGHDMEYLQMSANAITPAKKKVSLQVPENEEHLLIVKTGTLTIGLKIPPGRSVG